MKIGLVIAAMIISALPAQAVTIDTVPVGNPGNPADARSMYSPYGAVGHPYRIGKTEITSAQYAEFLNTVAASDRYGLYDTSLDGTFYSGIVRHNSADNYVYTIKPDAIGQGPGGTNYTYADKPALGVSWYDAVRFTNWLHNGQGSSDTENGAYTLLGPYTFSFRGNSAIPSNANSITRNGGARWWLPSEDEWYKAAYYDRIAGVYYSYPTGTDNLPDNNLPSSDTGNSANYCSGHLNCMYRATGNPSFPLTDAGAYTRSPSRYGTFDQGGNVFEWNETLISGSYRGIRGGSFRNVDSNLHAFNRYLIDPADQVSGYGFRVTTIIPEPPALFLSAIASLVTLATRRRNRLPTTADTLFDFL